MKRFKLVLVAFAMLSFVAFYGCQTTTEGDLEDALNELMMRNAKPEMDLYEYE